MAMRCELLRDGLAALLGCGAGGLAALAAFHGPAQPVAESGSRCAVSDGATGYCLGHRMIIADDTAVAGHPGGRSERIGTSSAPASAGKATESRIGATIVGPAVAATSVAPRSAHVVPNVGQWPGAMAAYGLRSRGMDIAFRESAFTMYLKGEAMVANEYPLLRDWGHRAWPTCVLEVTFPGSNAVQPRGETSAVTRFNYFVGDDESRWRCDVPSFSTIVYENIYDGIDLHVIGHNGGAGRVLKYEFHCAPAHENLPEADYTQIRIRYGGIDSESHPRCIAEAMLRLDESGDLIIHTALGTLRERAPIVWQTVGGQRRDIPACFELLDPQTYTIRLLSAVDPSHPLLIDPEVAWMTYVGGSGVEWGFGLAVDETGAALVTGYTTSTDFEGHTNGFHGGSSDVFVARVDPEGVVEWMTYLGGSGNLKFDLGRDIALDGNGNALVTGWTNSPDFAGANNSLHGTVTDAFVARLDRSGSLDWMTYLGGTSDDGGYGISVDGSGAALVTGQAYSTNFQGANNSHHGGNYDSFAARVLASGTLDWMTYLGGNDQDDASGIAVDADGAAFVAGDTWSSNFEGRINLPLGNRDAFIARIHPTGTIDWMAYFGGSANEACYAIALDGDGVALISGATTSLDFVGRNNSHHGGISAIDGFAARVPPSGTIEWMTYLGGSGEDHALRVAADAAGTAFVSGRTESTNFEGRDNAFHGGAADAFVVRVPTSGMIDWMTYLGGSGDDNGFDIALDDGGQHALLTGRTNSLDFDGQINEFHGGPSWGDAFVLNLHIAAGPGTPGDITGDGVVNINDLLAVINAWGLCPPPCPPSCAADVTNDCAVNINDLLVVINNWS